MSYCIGVFQEEPQGPTSNVVYVFARNVWDAPKMLLPCPDNSPALAIKCSPILYTLSQGK